MNVIREERPDINYSNCDTTGSHGDAYLVKQQTQLQVEAIAFKFKFCQWDEFSHTSKRKQHKLDQIFNHLIPNAKHTQYLVNLIPAYFPNSRPKKSR